MGRYTGSPDTLMFDQRVDLRGFSAGQLCWPEHPASYVEDPKWTNGGGIACPPQLIVTPPTDHTLHLLPL